MKLIIILSTFGQLTAFTSAAGLCIDISVAENIFFSSVFNPKESKRHSNSEEFKTIENNMKPEEDEIEEVHKPTEKEKRKMQEHFGKLLDAFDQIDLNDPYDNDDHGDELGDDHSNFEFMYGKQSGVKPEKMNDEQDHHDVSSEDNPGEMFELLTEVNE